MAREDLSSQYLCVVGNKGCLWDRGASRLRMCERVTVNSCLQTNWPWGTHVYIDTVSSGCMAVEKHSSSPCATSAPSTRLAEYRSNANARHMRTLARRGISKSSTRKRRKVICCAATGRSTVAVGAVPLG